MNRPTNTDNRNITALTALYCRLSKDDDGDGDSDSITHQKEMLLSYAQRNGFFNTEFYIDDGYTGTNFDRPDFKRMMCDIEDGKVKTVIVKDMSRFGREYLQVGTFTELIFPERGVRFIAVNDGVDSDKGYNDFIPFRNIINELYAKDTSRKIKTYVNSKGNNGKSLTNLPPYGYVFDKNDINVWHIDDSAAAVVRRIFSEFVAGKPVSQICRDLTADKVLSPMSYKRLYTLKNKCENIPDDKLCKWNSSAVLTILDNSIYIGELVNFKTASPSFKSKKRVFTPDSERKVFTDHHEPIIDRETWDAVRNLRKFKRKRTKRNTTPLFAGFVFCADCGAKMTYLSRSDNKNDAYICSSYRRNIHACTIHYINENVLKKLVLEKLQAVTDFARSSEKEFLSIACKASESASKRKKKSASNLMAKAQKRENELNTLVSALYEDKVTGNISIEVFNRLSEKYLTELHQLEDKKQELTDKADKLDKQKADVGSFVKLVKTYTEIDDITPELLGMFIDKILVYQAEKVDGKRTVKVDIYFKGLGNVNLF